MMGTPDNEQLKILKELMTTQGFQGQLGQACWSSGSLAPQQSPFPYASLNYPAMSIFTKPTVHFWRINERIEHCEGELIDNPVDRLRLRVARWLENKN